MVDTTPVGDQTHFATVCTDLEASELNDAQCEELWDVWSEYVDAYGDTRLVLVPEWFSENEFGSRRPFVFASVEHDDPDSGAVLFSDAELVNISIVENTALTTTPQIGLEEATEQLDVSGDDDYIDEPGKVWIPRSLMTVFERTTT